MWVESWRESFKNGSQWINTVISVVGATYLVMSDSMKADLPSSIVGAMAALAALNILVRNLQQRNKAE